MTSKFLGLQKVHGFKGDLEGIVDSYGNGPPNIGEFPKEYDILLMVLKAFPLVQKWGIAKYCAPRRGIQFTDLGLNSFSKEPTVDVEPCTKLC
jgi:hypothetical protein